MPEPQGPGWNDSIGSVTPVSQHGHGLQNYWNLPLGILGNFLIIYVELIVQQLCEIRLFAGSLVNLLQKAVSHFSAELTALIEQQFEGSQLKFGRAVGIDQSMVSRQCAGLSLPDRATIHRLTQALTEFQLIPLVVAYLQDHCPMSIRNKLSIHPAAPMEALASVENLQIDIGALSVRQRRIVRELLAMITADPEATAFLAAVLKFSDRPADE